MKPFITGSHAYGTPTAESDIDLVLPPMGQTELFKFVLLSDNSEFPIRYGKLNIIVPESKKHFYLWLNCTQELVKKKPVTREYAIEYIQQRFRDEELNLERTPSS